MKTNILLTNCATRTINITAKIQIVSVTLVATLTFKATLKFLF
jgi:hypothetical protein